MDTELAKFDENEYAARGQIGNVLLGQAVQLEVVDSSTFKAGEELLTAIKDKVRQIKPELDEPCEKANSLHKWLTGLRAKVLTPFSSAEAEVKKKLGDYQWQQQERKRKDDERIAAEAQRKAEEQRKAEIEEAKKRKDKEAVAELKAAPIVPEITKVSKVEVPEAENTSFRTDYDFEIVDASAIPRKYMAPDMIMIRRVVKALGKECLIPGIKIITRQVVTSRSAR